MIWLVLLLSTLGLGTGLVGDATGASWPELLEPSSPAPGLAPLESSAHGPRVEWDWAVVDRLADDQLEGFLVDLGVTRSLEGLVDYVRPRARGMVCVGGRLHEPSGDPCGEFTLVRSPRSALFIANLYDGQIIEVAPTREGHHRRRKVRVESFGTCAVEALPAAPLRRSVPTPSAQGSPDATPTIDVLMLYTRKVAREHSQIAIELTAAASIESAEAAYRNSEINLELRPVGLIEVAFDEEDGGTSDWLRFLKHPQGAICSDSSGDYECDPEGYMDEVLPMRDAFGADLVALLVETGGAGIGYVLRNLDDPDGASGMSISKYSAAVGNQTFAHELGHNQGATHARGDGGGTGNGLYSYSWGHRWTGEWSGIPYSHRTIMAYSPGSRLRYFSNPNVNTVPWGDATGVPIGEEGEAHNAQTITNVRSFVSGYREHRKWVDFEGSGGEEDGSYEAPFSTLAGGLEGVGRGEGVVMKGGETSETPLIDQSVLLDSYPGSSLIGGD